MPFEMPLRYWVLLIFVASALYAHLRGKVRFGLLRALTDFTVLIAPVNALMYLFSRAPATPYLDPKAFKELELLQQNWQVIREEALRLNDEGQIKAASTYNDIGFNSFFRTGWKRFYLKWYGNDLQSAQAMCPRTVALLKQIPTVKAAMFASLPPGSRLVRHRDPYAGSLRYHLGLVTPNSPECFIVVDGEKYYWKDGEAVMFDETYIHTAENRTDVTRVILFCDVERPLSNPLVRALNRTIGRSMIKAAATQNMPGEHVGVLNRVFEYVYRIRILGTRIKAWNRPVYYLLKWLLIGAVLYAILV